MKKRDEAKKQILAKDEARKKAWIKPIFKDLRLGFEITMYFWNR